MKIQSDGYFSNSWRSKSNNPLPMLAWEWWGTGRGIGTADNLTEVQV